MSASFTKKTGIKIALASLALTAAFSSMLAPIAQAHVLQTDGNIGAVLHIDPDDDPIIGQPATFFFEFRDKENKFQLSGCVCIAKILNNGTVIFSEGLLPASASVADQLQPLFQYTFQQKGVYTVDVSGMPNTPGGFQNFDLKYNIRVDRTAIQSNLNQSQAGTAGSSHLWHVVIILAALPIAFIINKVLEKRRKNNPAQSKNNTPPPKPDQN